MSKTDTMVATIIHQQLGGRRFAFLTGAKNFLAHESALSFRIGRNKSKANRVLITLTPADTYTVEFQKVTTGRVTKAGEFVEGGVKTLVTCEDIYCDMLQECFENNTGLYCHL